MTDGEIIRGTDGVEAVHGDALEACRIPLHLYTSKRFAPVRFAGLDQADEQPEDPGPLHEVRIIDNDYNTYQEVMQITMIALGLDEEQAFTVAWEVDHYGSCVVAVASREEAEGIADMIRVIGIEVQVNPVSVWTS